MCYIALQYATRVYLLLNSDLTEQLVYEFFIKSTPERDENCESR